MVIIVFVIISFAAGFIFGNFTVNKIKDAEVVRLNKLVDALTAHGERN